MKTTILDEVTDLTCQVKLVNDSLMEFNISENTGESLEEIFRGALKWDGCINIEFQESLHFCGNPGEKFKAIFDRLYALGAEMMPNFDYTNID